MTRLPKIPSRLEQLRDSIVNAYEEFMFWYTLRKLRLEYHKQYLSK